MHSSSTVNILNNIENKLIPVEETVNNQQLFSQLFIYINQNTAIHHALNEIQNTPERILKTNELLSAIKNGNECARIFEDHDCHLYLLHLIKTNQIPFLQGMSVYIYLLALMQFTEKQNLKESDLQFKSKRELKIFKLVENECLTPEGDKYLKEISTDLTKYFNPSHQYEHLVQFVLTLPPSEQWVMLIPFIHVIFPDRPNFDSWIMNLKRGKTIPFFLSTTTISENQKLITSSQDQEEVYFPSYFPSLSIIKFCKQIVSASPIDWLFAFGSTGTHTRDDLHQNGKHPILIYSPLVKSNLNRAHNMDIGTIGVISHDICHSFWGSLLPDWFRNLIFKFLIPTFNHLKSKAVEYHDNEVVALIESIIDTLADFDLLNSATIISEEERLTDYLERCLKRIEYKGFFSNPDQSFKAIGDNHYHRLYFLVKQHELTALQNSTDKEIIIFKKIITAIEKLIKSRQKGNSILSALRCLVESTTSSESFDRSFDWERWFDILYKHRNNKNEIWGIVKEDCHDELLLLIREYQLKFFHPYLPLTDNQYYKLMRLINTIGINNDETPLEKTCQNNM